MLLEVECSIQDLVVVLFLSKNDVGIQVIVRVHQHLEIPLCFSIQGGPLVDHVILR